MYERILIMSRLSAEYYISDERECCTPRITRNDSISAAVGLCSRKTLPCYCHAVAARIDAIVSDDDIIIVNVSYQQ